MDGECTCMSTRSVAEVDADIAKTKDELVNARGKPTEVYARIVGYYRAVRNWNKGKTEEFKHRVEFDPENSDINGHLRKVGLEPSAGQESSAVEQSQSDTTSAVPTEDVSYEAKTNGARKYILLYRTTCPNCPPVKAELSKINMTNEWFNVDEEAGLAKAQEYGVMSVPTVILFETHLGVKRELGRAHTAKEVQELFAGK